MRLVSRGLVVDGTLIKEAVAGMLVQVVLDRTSFYAPGWWPVGDRGIIQTTEGQVEVKNTIEAASGTIVQL